MRSHFRRRARLGLASLLALTTGALWSAAPAMAADSSASGVYTPATCANTVRNTTVLTQGHVDAFTPVKNGDGISLVMAEDVSQPGKHTFRNPNYVILGVKDSALQQETAKIPGLETAGYFLPMTQGADLIWPGWDSDDLKSDFDVKAVRYVFDAIEGPGTMFAFTQDGLAGLAARATNGKMALASGSVIEQNTAAHEHVNWLFSTLGTYAVTVHAELDTKDGKTFRSEQAVYRWAVGAAAIDSAKKTADTESAARCADGGNGSTDKPSGDQTPGDKQSKGTENPGSQGNKNSGGDSNGQSNTQGGNGDLDGALKNVLGLGGSPAAPAAGGSSPVAPGSNSQATSQQCLPTPVKTEISKEEAEQARQGGGAQAGGQQGASALGSHTIAANTHVHPNWVFTAPGEYKVNLTATATLKDGSKVSAPTTLTFNVGGAGNADDGHFDLGATIENGKLVPLIKDDRKSPSQWVPANSLTFGVGAAAKAKAPAGLEFIAPEGTEIYTISSTQVPGVPWLGMNTMHPDFLANTSGELTWTLNSISGPGSLGVFTSGNLGQVVGERWFGGVAGSAQTPTATISEENGKYYRTTVEGRTPAGEPCDLSASGNLSHSGANTVPMAALAGLFLVAGAAAALAGTISHRKAAYAS
ncbi:choice-of-anchor M domain-containing protein [uncultured Actinobaculum sp.]|uniref:choice-of-anchor M domain-containing protein n=1 Tax=uncultured Actinobaculum sp. TaxID=655643 RepID=UPI0028047A55|nr:choice-of-anchor M domain-containing protein [uncultured Actinobaculum sp.]